MEVLHPKGMLAHEGLSHVCLRGCQKRQRAAPFRGGARAVCARCARDWEHTRGGGLVGLSMVAHVQTLC